MEDQSSVVVSDEGRESGEGEDADSGVRVKGQRRNLGAVKRLTSGFGCRRVGSDGEGGWAEGEAEGGWVRWGLGYGVCAYFKYMLVSSNLV